MLQGVAGVGNYKKSCKYDNIVNKTKFNNI
jgi:hypothetical protein